MRLLLLAAAAAVAPFASAAALQCLAVCVVLVVVVCSSKFSQRLAGDLLVLNAMAQAAVIAGRLHGSSSSNFSDVSLIVAHGVGLTFLLLVHGLRDAKHRDSLN